MTHKRAMTNEKTPYNTGFASGGVTCKLGALCFYSSSVQVDSFVLRNPPERKARKRCVQHIFRTYAESFSPIFSERNLLKLLPKNFA